MKKRKEQKVYYRMTFSMGKVTNEEVDYVRGLMHKLEQHENIMKCFQNRDRATNKSEHQQRMFFTEGTDFTVYYREEEVDALTKMLFKLKLKFPDFVVHTAQTLQEHF